MNKKKVTCVLCITLFVSLYSGGGQFIPRDITITLLGPQFSQETLETVNKIANLHFRVSFSDPLSKTVTIVPPAFASCLACSASYYQYTVNNKKATDSSVYVPTLIGLMCMAVTYGVYTCTLEKIVSEPRSQDIKTDITHPASQDTIMTK